LKMTCLEFEIGPVTYDDISEDITVTCERQLTLIHL
jgi:hypothetical protein